MLKYVLHFCRGHCLEKLSLCVRPEARIQSLSVLDFIICSSFLKFPNPFFVSLVALGAFMLMISAENPLCADAVPASEFATAGVLVFGLQNLLFHVVMLVVLKC